MSALQIKAAAWVAGFAICMALLAAGQWNTWTWLGASVWTAGALGAMEGERQRRDKP